jgi:hypothetical protein
VGQPQFNNASIKPLLVVGPFAGLDASTDPYYVDGTFAIDVTNLVPNRTYQAYASMRGRVLDAPSIPGTALLGLSLYYVGGALPDKIAASNVGGAFELSALTPGGGSYAPISLAALPGVPSPLPATFASYMKWLFEANSDPTGVAIKLDQSLAPTFWQIYPPTLAPMLVSRMQGQVGLFGTGYYWRTTYSNANQESSPGPILGPFDMGTTLAPPNANNTSFLLGMPLVAATTGTGAVPPGVYYVAVTLLTPAGESGLSSLFGIVLSATGELTVTVTDSTTFPNPNLPGATGYNTYISTDAVNYHLQSGTNTPINTNNVVTAYNAAGAPPPVSTIGTTVAPPPAPVLSAAAGGTLIARTEYYVITYVFAANQETSASSETSISVPANELVTVQSPSGVPGATGYNVYGSKTSGQEVKQNVAPIAIGTNWTEPTVGLILGEVPTINAPGSNDPQTVEVNLYRIGGSLGQWLFVGNTTNNPAGVTFVDTEPDAVVTGQSLVLHRDPPAPFGAICAHKERIWGFGYPAYTQNGSTYPAAPCDLWYSNYAEPWGFDNTNQVIPIGSHVTGDVAVQVVSLSSILVAFKSKTTWAVYGESASDFFAQKLFDVGCASAASVVNALGVVFWLSDQGIYMFDGSSLSYLSQKIKKLLDGFSAADFAASTGAFSDRMYWLSFPTQGISLGYDTVTQTWWKSSFSTTLFAFDPEAATRATSPDLVVGATLLLGALRTEQWFSAETDRGQPITSKLTSRLGSTQEQTIGTMRVRYLELNANLSPTDQVSITIDANPASATPPPFTQAFSGSTIPRQLISVPPGVQGQILQLSIVAVTSDAFVLEAAAAHGWVRRVYSVYG